MSENVSPGDREEEYLSAIAEGQTANIDPATREEALLYAIANGDKNPNIDPASRKEALLKVIAEQGAGAEVESLSVTENGTYTADEGKAYSPVTVNVPNTYTDSDLLKVVRNLGQIKLLLPQSGTLNVGENGEYDVKEYASVKANVPNSYAAADAGKVVAADIFGGYGLVEQTARPSAITSNGTYDTTNHNSVSVSVPNSYGAGDEGKVVSGGALVSQTDVTKTANGTYDTTTVKQVTVSVANTYSSSDNGKVVKSDGQGGYELYAQTAHADVTPTTSDQTVYTTSNNSVKVKAISPTKIAATYTPGTTDQTIQSGRWLTGNQTIKGDANLVAGNIKSGVTIFGVTGSYSGGGGGGGVTVETATGTIANPFGNISASDLAAALAAGGATAYMTVDCELGTQRMVAMPFLTAGANYAGKIHFSVGDYDSGAINAYMFARYTAAGVFEAAHGYFDADVSIPGTCPTELTVIWHPLP